MNRSRRALFNLGRKLYTGCYLQGWNHAQTQNASLDKNPFSGDRNWAWEDGYMDYAGDRPKYHRRDCLEEDHNECSTL